MHSIFTMNSGGGGGGNQSGNFNDCIKMTRLRSGDTHSLGGGGG